MITRTHHEDGQVFTREETVRRPEVIQAYIRLKQKEKEVLHCKLIVLSISVEYF